MSAGSEITGHFSVPVILHPTVYEEERLLSERRVSFVARFVYNQLHGLVIYLCSDSEDLHNCCLVKPENLLLRSETAHWNMPWAR